MKTHRPAQTAAPTAAAAVEPAQQRDARQAVWTRHWSSGAAHSCARSYGDRYGGAIAAFWAEVLTPLQAGQRVLDIATGNGALPALLLGALPDTDVRIDAIDLAAIAPAWLQTLPQPQRQRLRFHGGQAAEQLPFPDGSFDLVISQYGLEYSQLELALPELLRVVRPGGRVALLLHHAGSRPVTLAAVELAHLEWLCADSGLLACARAMFEPLSRAATAAGRAALDGDPAANAARDSFNLAQDTLRLRARETDGADILFETQEAVNRLLGLAASQRVSEAQQQWRQLHQALQDAQLRLQELRGHALDQGQVDALCGRLVERLPQVTARPVHEQGFLMGWTVCAAAAS